MIGPGTSSDKTGSGMGAVILAHAAKDDGDSKIDSMTAKLHACRELLLAIEHKDPTELMHALDAYHDCGNDEDSEDY